MFSGFEYMIFIIGGIICLIYGVAAGIAAFFSKK